LILHEFIEPRAIMPGFIFGLLPGWWLGNPRVPLRWAYVNRILGAEDIRKLSPLLTENNWHEYLAECGFSGVDISHHGLIGQRRHACSAMVSTASEATRSNSAATESIILVAGHSTCQLSIARQLTSQLEVMGFSNCQTISPSHIASVDFSQVICIFICELEQPFLHGIGEQAYTNLQKIVSSAQGLLWTTSSSAEFAAGPVNEMIVGLLRCLSTENPGLKIVSLALEASHDISRAVQTILKVFSNAVGKSSGESETEYVEKDSVLYINRVVGANYLDRHIFQKTMRQHPQPRKFYEEPSRPLKLSIDSPGMLDTLQFVDDTLAGQPVAPDEIEVEVKASGVNFRDVLVALGQDLADYIGLECAGVVSQAGSKTNFEAGDRVCCIAESSVATYARCKAIVAVKIPNDMTFTTAAALVISHCTACYSLIHRAQIKPRESILIHSGAGGLGQACIQLAKLFDAEIYVTVGSDDKRRLVMDEYDVPENHIFSSRTPAFVQRIKDLTNGRGVDIVVNSLAGEALQASWECIAPFGRFLETGKKDILYGGKLPMFPFSKEASFIAIDLFYFSRHASTDFGDVLSKVMSLVEEGKIKVPSPLAVYKASQIEEAFRYMQSGKSKGKIVIEFNDDDVVPVRTFISTLMQPKK
jgi:NADPH:quinone reductase-like Zn-dependent oxidoreductase